MTMVIAGVDVSKAVLDVYVDGVLSVHERLIRF